MQLDHRSILTLGELKQAGYHSRSVKQELRDNLLLKLKQRETVFPGIYGLNGSS